MSRINSWLRISVFTLAFLIALGTYERSLDDIQNRMHQLRTTYLEHGHSGLSFIDKLAIYGSFHAMTIGSLAFWMPEIALENLLLSFPGRGDRVWHSSFAMGSNKVRGKVSSWLRILESKPSTVDSVKFPMTQISWVGYENDSPRVALALNAFNLTGLATRNEGKWHLTLRGWVPVKYPKKSWTKLPLFGNKPFYIEEGLFWALQKEGWLFPYRAIYTWTVVK